MVVFNSDGKMFRTQAPVLTATGAGDHLVPIIMQQGERLLVPHPPREGRPVTMERPTQCNSGAVNLSIWQFYEWKGWIGVKFAGDV